MMHMTSITLYDAYDFENTLCDATWSKLQFSKEIWQRQTLPENAQWLISQALCCTGSHRRYGPSLLYCSPANRVKDKSIRF